MTRVTLIAEVATNAGHSLVLAKQFIQTFAGAGADLIKFQLTRARRLAADDPQRDWMEHAEWSVAEVGQIQDLCDQADVKPLWTVYHAHDVPIVAAHEQIKVGSGEAHQGALAAAVLATKAKTIYVSEGLYAVHNSYRRDSRVVLLGCSTRYPAPHGLVALRFAKGGYHGWSDHAIGLEESHLAVALGATVIERHVQLPQQARPGQPWELTPAEFAELRHRVDERPERFLDRWEHVLPEAEARAGRTTVAEATSAAAAARQAARVAAEAAKLAETAARVAKADWGRGRG